MRARVEKDSDVIYERYFSDTGVRGTAYVEPATKVESDDGSSFCISNENVIRNGQSGFTLDCVCSAINSDGDKKWENVYAAGGGYMGFLWQIDVGGDWALDSANPQPVDEDVTFYTQVNSQAFSDLKIFSATAGAEIEYPITLV